MRICLISAATISYFGEDWDDRKARYRTGVPPLGVLTLAAVLRTRGIEPVVVDLNRLYGEYRRQDRALREARDFCDFAVERVAPGFDIVGLSTICSSYPLTLRLAQKLRAAQPGAAILLGGPQASAVDEATLRAFPFVDAIVRGEADETILRLLDAGVRSEGRALVPGITCRDGRGRVIRNAEAPLITELDSIPFPAFDLAPGFEESGYVSLEIGRGCPFSCTFCSTNDFFRRRFRLKSPATMIGQMRRVRSEYGVDSFELVHDMFTVDRKRVAEFCEALLASGEGFRWTCSARTDCVDPALIELMKRAGCKGLFFGIETGSPRLQAVVDKGLDLEQAAAHVACSAASGMHTTVSLITGFPEETEEDLAQTVDFLLDAARYERTEPQLHILAPLSGTPIERRFRGQLRLHEAYSDISHQGWLQDAADLEMIAAHPDIFANFYEVPAPALDRNRLKRLRDFVMQGLARFRWLFVALHQSKGGLPAMFDAWERSLPATGRNGDERAEYYASTRFRGDFVAFVRRAYLQHPEADPALDALVRFEEGLDDRPVSKSSSAATTQRAEARLDEIIPCIPPRVRIVEMDVDLVQVIERLRRKEGLSAPDRRPVRLATRPCEVQGTDIIQLSPLSAAFLGLCDGARTLAGVASALQVPPSLEAPVEQVCAVAFEELCRQGLLEWREAA